MAKLKLGAIGDDRPVKVTIELPAEIDRDLKAYAELLKRETGQSVNDTTRLIGPMLKQFMATDRAFRKFRRQSAQAKAG